MSELPPVWRRVALAEVAEVRLGRQRSPKRATGDRMRPYLRAANVTWRGLQLADVKEMDFTEQESSTYELQPGDLLLAEASGSPGEVGKPAQFKGEIEGCCFQNTLLRVRLPQGLSPNFYEHFFREQALNGRFAAGSRGVGIHHLGAAALSKWQIPIPPSAEQERIVVAIDEAFSKLEAGESALRTVRQLLERLRDAVLTAAVTGRLVSQDPSETPASKLLASLGVSPVCGDALPPVPDGWSWAALGEGVGQTSITDGPFGSNLKTEHYTEAGPRVVRLQNIGDGVFRDAKAHISEENFQRLRKHEVVAGDVLIASLGEILPRACIAPHWLGPAIVKADCIRVRPGGAFNGAFLMIALSSPMVRRGVSASIKGVGRPRLNLSEIRTLVLPVPPLFEQVRIVAEFERQTSFIAACERAVDAGLARSTVLRRSVLKAACEGHLVPQDRSDEPASVLLERIRAERPQRRNPSRYGREPNVSSRHTLDWRSTESARSMEGET